LRLVIFPVVLGAGERLFGETSEEKPMRLIQVATIGDGLSLVTYEACEDASERRIFKEEVPDPKQARDVNDLVE
jgi:hypothetical protein